MKDKFAFTKGRFAGFICCALIPVVAMVIGIAMLTKNVMFNRGVGITFFLIPLIAVGLLALCLFYKGKTWKKIVLASVVLIIYVISFTMFSLFTEIVQVKCYNGSEVDVQYKAVRNENPLMPEVSQIGQTVDLSHYHITSVFFIFSSETDYLICRYPQEEYEIQKTRLDSAYTFQTETIRVDDSSCEPMIEIDGYKFRMLSVEDHELFYPKEVFLIGYSDDAREIVYIAFEDYDLDIISSLKEFIMNECEWKYVRQ